MDSLQPAPASASPSPPLNSPSLLAALAVSSVRVVAARALAVALGTALVGWLTLKLFPTLELDLFSRSAATLAALFTGSPVQRVAEGWALPAAAAPVVVTAACRAVDFFLMVAVLLGWRLGRTRLGEHLLRDVLRELRITADLPQRHRIHEPDAPLHEFGKGDLGLFLGVTTEQCDIFDHGGDAP
ncbi:MAG: hypothetical protein RLZZ15_925 [Verrucomicrobiota bacterium]|jgi:hypothetical protein